MRPVIYMLDTNILVNWFYSRTPDFEGSLLTPWQCQYISDIRDFCEQNENDIYIPDLVWCEFLSVILHKEMELCADLDGLNQWFRDREIIIQQLELAIDGNPRLHRFLWAGTMSPYVDAEVLVRDPELIDDNLYPCCDHFFDYLDKYVIICKQATDKNNTHGMSPTPPKILLGNALELLCRCNPLDMPEQIQRWVSVFAAIQAPDWGHELALSVLLEKLFNERRNFERPTYLTNTRHLAEAYLALSESGDHFRRPRVGYARAQVMNLLSDIAYFQKDEDGEREALSWANRCLEINPGDRFALAQKRFIQERQTVQEQIRRFEHDTNAAIAGIVGTMDMIMNDRNTDQPNLFEKLNIIRLDLNRIQTVNRFVSDKQPTFQEVDPVDPIREISKKYQKVASVSVISTTENVDQKWDTDIDYLCLALDNLLKNAVEAFERRRIPLSERRIDIEINLKARSITVTDNAGGVDPTVQSRIFEPYTSTKGIKQKTGLGLSQARMAIEDRLEGQLQLAVEQPPDGARFEIYLIKQGDV